MATGDLVVKVLSDTSNYSAGLRKAGQDARNFQNDAVAAGRRSGSNSFLALEAGRLAEDLSIGYQINGLRGALQGAGNNITQMASIVSPLAGGIAGLAVAGIGIAPMLYSWATAAKEVTDKTSEMTRAMREASAGAAELRKRDRERGAFGGLDAGGLGDRKAVTERAFREVVAKENDKLAEIGGLIRGAGGDDATVRRITTALRRGGDISGTLKSAMNPAPDVAIKGLRMPWEKGESRKFSDEMVNEVVKMAKEFRALNFEAEELRKDMGRVLELAPIAKGEDAAAKAQAKLQQDFELLESRRQPIRDQMDRIVEETRTPLEKFAESMKEMATMRQVGGAFDVPIDDNALMRKQGIELRRLAESRGLLGPSPGMAGGALRGSADDYRARMNTSGKDPSTLLEKQIKAVEEGNATQEDVKRIMQAISDRLGEPVPVVEI